MKNLQLFLKRFLITTKTIRYHGNLGILQEIFEDIATNKNEKE